MQINFKKIFEKTGITELVVGRESSQIKFSHATVSRQHAFLRRLGDQQIMISDLGSLNGVLVNGEKVEEAILNHGDMVELGEISFTVNYEMTETHLLEEPHSIIRNVGDWIASSPDLRKILGG